MSKDIVSRLFARLVQIAVEQARKSPCQKSKRGAVVYDIRNFGVVGIGFNGLPRGRCTGDATCRELCSLRCQHAEQRAVRDAARKARAGQMSSLALVHAKVDENGDLATSGEPSCAVCSGVMLDAGIRHVWLYYANARDVAGEGVWTRYDAATFHDMSVKAHVARARGRVVA